MAIYTINRSGSAVTTFPSTLSVGDVLVFNRTGAGYSGTILNWVVPVSGVYRINAIGAGGGTSGGVGGRGASISANYTLLAGETIKILVGQAGTNNVASTTSWYAHSGGGGGGTFVTRADNRPLIIAGGGGGGGEYYPSGTTPSNVTIGQDASLTTTATGFNSGTGGHGSTYDSTSGTGGGGLLSDGRQGNFGRGGKGFVNGGLGGNWDTGNGGFGGGGSTGFAGGGGGGGYNGGGGSGGGGSSYVGIGTNVTAMVYGIRTHGLVEITVLELGNLSLTTKIGGVIREYDNGWVRIDGQLRDIDKMWTKVNGVIMEV